MIFFRFLSEGHPKKKTLGRIVLRFLSEGHPKIKILGRRL